MSSFTREGGGMSFRIRASSAAADGAVVGMSGDDFVSIGGNAPTSCDSAKLRHTPSPPSQIDKFRAAFHSRDLPLRQKGKSRGQKRCNRDRARSPGIPPSSAIAERSLKLGVVRSS